IRLSALCSVLILYFFFQAEDGIRDRNVTGVQTCALPISKIHSHQAEKERFIMAKVESFTLDHTKVKAPYVRLITVEEGVKGDKISNYDLRLVQPNENAIPTAGLHTIEHLLAGLLRDRLDGVIDCSPFGCRTGFHLITWGEHSTTEVAKALKSSLEEIAYKTKWEDVQGTTIESCGNYRDHSLFSAKEWSKKILDEGISDKPFERHVVD